MIILNSHTQPAASQWTAGFTSSAYGAGRWEHDNLQDPMQFDSPIQVALRFKDRMLASMSEGADWVIGFKDLNALADGLNLTLDEYSKSANFDTHPFLEIAAGYAVRELCLAIRTHLTRAIAWDDDQVLKQARDCALQLARDAARLLGEFDEESASKFFAEMGRIRMRFDQVLEDLNRKDRESLEK